MAVYGGMATHSFVWSAGAPVCGALKRGTRKKFAPAEAH
jgi:hypothetical protein